MWSRIIFTSINTNETVSICCFQDFPFFSNSSQFWTTSTILEELKFAMSCLCLNTVKILFYVKGSHLVCNILQQPTLQQLSSKRIILR